MDTQKAAIEQMELRRRLLEAENEARVSRDAAESLRIERDHLREQARRAIGLLESAVEVREAGDGLLSLVERMIAERDAARQQSHAASDDRESQALRRVQWRQFLAQSMSAIGALEPENVEARIGLAARCADLLMHEESARYGVISRPAGEP